MSKIDKQYDTYYEALIEESDRGCVLVGASMLEHLSEKLIRGKLFLATKGSRKDATHSLFDRNGPFSSFWSNINFIYAIGFIRKDYYNDLHIIRQIRNEVAHNFDVVSFGDKKIANKTERLKSYIKASNIMAPYVPDNNNAKTKNTKKTRIADKVETERYRFIMSASYIGGVLDTQIEELNVLAPGIIEMQNEGN